MSVEQSMLTLDPSDWLTFANVLLTGAFAGLTFFILRANRATVKAMEAQLDQQNRPYIEMRVEGREGHQLIDLIIENTGKSAAHNLRLEIDKDVFQFGESRLDSNLRSFTAFSEKIDSFPPNSTLIFTLGTGPSVFGEQNSFEPRVPLTFAIQSTYDWNAKSFDEVSNIDLRPLLNTTVRTGIIGEELQKIRKVLERTR